MRDDDEVARGLATTILLGPAHFERLDERLRREDPSVCVDCDRGATAHLYAGFLWHWYESKAGAHPVCYRRPCHNAAE